jgi:hypothetical protein
MKRIKEFCLEILNKVKEHIAAVIAMAFISSILALLLVFKKYLTTAYTFALPLWVWIVLCVVIACPLAIIIKIIDLLRRQKVLTDKDDILNKLNWWLGQQQCFVREQTEDNKLVTWHFSLIDKNLGLSPGSAKKFLPVMLSTKHKVIHFAICNEGKETISIRYYS